MLPSFLSCGSADGTVCVYNVKEVDNVTILDSLNNAAHGHVSPVWQVRKESPFGETVLRVRLAFWQPLQFVDVAFVDQDKLC